jgi:large subunit ribosomal protein L18
MKKKVTFKFRRKREGKTDYKKRISLLLSHKPRLVIRNTNRGMILQMTEYSPKGDKIVASVLAADIKEYGWKAGFSNISAAYLAGLLLGKKAAEKKIKDAVLDLGLQKSVKGSRIYSAVKGVIDSGIKVPAGPEILPSQDRISGKHISEYAKKIKADKARYSKQFSAYIKANFDPESITAHFEEVKKKIMGK